MQSSDYPEFEATIRQLEKVFGKKSLDDDTIKAYWNALRDLHIEQLKRRSDEHIKRGKFFPKPAELRPKDTSPVAEHDERSRKEMEQFNAASIAFWDERMARNPMATKWEILAAYEARTSVIAKPGTPEFVRRTEFAIHTRSLLMRDGREYA